MNIRTRMRFHVVLEYPSGVRIAHHTTQFPIRSGYYITVEAEAQFRSRLRLYMTFYRAHSRCHLLAIRSGGVMCLIRYSSQLLPHKHDNSVFAKQTGKQFTDCISQLHRIYEGTISKMKKSNQVELAF